MSERLRKKQRLEISVMYEPHRCQQALVRAAYTQVLPELKRLAWSKLMESHQGEAVPYAEGKRAG